MTHERRTAHLPHRYHVLVVDDDESNCDLLRVKLSLGVYSVATAECVAAAIKEIAKRVPDLVLLDITMPGVTGLEFLSQLRQEDKTRALPVILVSAMAESDAIVRGLMRGANDYVTKPFSFPVLKARMESQLRIADTIARLKRSEEHTSELQSRFG